MVDGWYSREDGAARDRGRARAPRARPTSRVTESYRTPDERFDGLPGYAFEPHYRECDGLRLALRRRRPDDGPPVVFIHGEPTWSLPVAQGRSRRCRDAGLSLHRAGPAGLRALGQADGPRLVLLRPPHRGDGARCSSSSTCATRRSSSTTGAGRSGCASRVEHPDRIARLVILDTGLFTGRQHMSDAWIAFRDFVERTEDLPIGLLVQGACARDCRRRGRRRLRGAVPDARVARPARAPSR